MKRAVTLCAADTQYMYDTADVQREGILLGSQAEGHELPTAWSGIWSGVSWLYHNMVTKSRKGSPCLQKEHVRR